MTLAELVALAQTLAATDEEQALDLALDAVDTALQNSRFAEVDDLLRDLDLGPLNLDLAVLVLMATKPARTRLPARADAVARFADHVRMAEPERAEKIVRWL